MTSCRSSRLCACLLNISEARDNLLVERVASSALKINRKTENKYKLEGSPFKIKSSVLNIFSDYDYNRSVITIVSRAENIGQSVSDACCTAYELIDLSKHEGGHPRLGSVDLVPIHPLSADTSLKECGNIAQEIAKNVTRSVPGSSVFLFGAADEPEWRGLVARRKAVKWFQGQHGSSYENIQHDVGVAPSSRYGLTGIGAIPYVTNCNVTIDTDNVNFGKQIASAIRATAPGGLRGVQSMAFPHEGKVEIACNVEGIVIDAKSTENNTSEDDNDLICSFGQYFHVPVKTVEKRIAQMASVDNVATIGTAIIGFTPEEAERRARHALTEGIEEFWKLRSGRYM